MSGLVGADTRGGLFQSGRDFEKRVELRHAQHFGQVRLYVAQNHPASLGVGVGHQRNQVRDALRIDEPRTRQVEYQPRAAIDEQRMKMFAKMAKPARHTATIPPYVCTSLLASSMILVGVGICILDS